MTGLPFPYPQNANEARGNALYYATRCESSVVAGASIWPGQADATKAQVWAAIALSLPEAEFVTVEDGQDVGPLLEPWPNQPSENLPPLQPLADVTAYLPDMDSVEHTGHAYPSGGTGGTITVDSLAWDVLRALAARYVRASLDKSVSVDLNDEETTDWELMLKHNDGTSVVTATVEPLP